MSCGWNFRRGSPDMTVRMQRQMIRKMTGRTVWQSPVVVAWTDLEVQADSSSAVVSAPQRR
jgi:hypothetical protein